VCESDQELIPASIRGDWIRKEYRTTQQVEVVEFTYSENQLPNRSDSCPTVLQLRANVFRKLLPRVDLAITSEPYGDYVAEYFNIKHLSFDREIMKKYNGEFIEFSGQLDEKVKAVERIIGGTLVLT
jgi:HTH-type transcriptional repressor of NAD biosynthesis genes